VILFLKDGQRVSGGLHEVRDSSLVIYSRAQGKGQKNGVAYGISCRSTFCSLEAFGSSLGALAVKEVGIILIS